MGTKLILRLNGNVIEWAKNYALRTISAFQK